MLRARVSAQGGPFATGVAHVGDGSVSDRVAAMRSIADGAGVDWFPAPTVAPRTGRAGIARRGEAWTAWAAGRLGNTGASQTYGSEREALTGLLQLLKATKDGEE